MGGYFYYVQRYLGFYDIDDLRDPRFAIKGCFAHFAEFHRAVYCGVNRVILAEEDILAGHDMRTALAQDDLTDFGLGAVADLDP